MSALSLMSTNLFQVLLVLSRHLRLHRVHLMILTNSLREESYDLHWSVTTSTGELLPPLVKVLPSLMYTSTRDTGEVLSPLESCYLHWTLSTPTGEANMAHSVNVAKPTGFPSPQPPTRLGCRGLRSMINELCPGLGLSLIGSDEWRQITGRPRL